MVIVELIAVAQGAVTVPVGETCRVELQDISTTGYRWQAKGFDQTVVTLKGDHLVPGDAPGASGKRSYDFLAIASGHTVVHFDLSRPWEKNSVAIKQAEVDVTVK